MDKFIKFVLVCLIVSVVAACGFFREPIPATSCYLIETKDDPEKERFFNYGRQLVPYFETFAISAGLTLPESESPGGSYSYPDSNRGLMMKLSLGAGIRRALGVVYVAPDMPCPICDDFERFMVEEVGQAFTVIDCDDDEDFGGAVLYGADLRK